MLIKTSERHRGRGRPAGSQANESSTGLDRRSFLKRSGLAAGALAAVGNLPLGGVRQAEAGPPPPVGATAERSRLAELVIIEALSRHVYWLPPGGKGWIAGLNDRYVGRALALVHGRPSEPWTVERLGRQVGLSRSALADHFSEVMGEPIFAFLTRWRLLMAAEYLLTTTRRVESIAHDAGYESAGAFSAAFKRAFGKPPSIWRRRRRGRGA